MTLKSENHRLITSPALAPENLQDPSELRDATSAAGLLTIGLVNNMPDAALQATERQFMRLLQAGAGNHSIHFHCFSLPSIQRSEPARRRIKAHYTDIAELGRLPLDGLIVTGAEPNAESLPQEPFWRELTAIIDWAAANTRSTIWSCLAAHAAVLHLDGIERQRLGAKCSGIYDCTRATSHWLTEDLALPVKIPHSRLNELRERDLAANGYQLLTRAPEAGADIFVKQINSQFIFFQGHPEYDALSLQHEYLRDISRFLAGERPTCPNFPAGYYEPETEAELDAFRERASRERRPALSAELPKLRIRGDIGAGAAATVIFRNWLAYLAGGERAIQPL
jgi:homoserine O-succinyltransferase